MAIVGHADMSVTNKYICLAGVDIKEGITEKLGYYAHESAKNNVVNLLSR